MLFITAGSGITPVMSMLRCLERTGEMRDVVHLHSARTEDDANLRRPAAVDGRAAAGYRLHLQLTGTDGRLTPDHFDERCPDWAERETFLCGPTEMLDAMREHWERGATATGCTSSTFQPTDQVGEGERGDGGTIRFTDSGVEATSDGDQPILVAGEDAGATLPYGCRMGICHTCVGKLCSGQVRDLRTGKVSGTPGEMVRTCVNAPEGAVEIAL